MYSRQDQEHQTDKDPSLPSLGVPASVIVSGNFAGVPPSGQDGPLAEPLPGQSPSPSPGTAHMAAVVPQVDQPLLPCSAPPPCCRHCCLLDYSLSNSVPAHFSFDCASLSSSEHICPVICPLPLPSAAPALSIVMSAVCPSSSPDQPQY